MGVLTLASVGVLLAFDAWPRLFPAGAHEALSAFPLVSIAVACLIHQATRRASSLEWVKAAIVALAFLFWAANQLYPHCPLATVFNDVAVAGFVLDGFLILIGWPSADTTLPTLAGRAPVQG